MDPSRQQRIDAVLARALDLPPADRQALVEEACGADAELRREVERLLAFAGHGAAALEPGTAAHELLLAAVAAAAPDARGEAVAGESIGAWRVVREIGRGGMGAVYLVDRVDGTFEQRAALKLVRAGDGDLQRRFERERRILASLADPGIARVIDGGRTPDGREYLVMEYVDGQPIDQYCDQHRLPIDARLALFARVCRAVQHAHSRLVVHRDLKPSNVLVTADGDVRLLDFGIARLLDSRVADSSLTQPAARVLTPDYASPELARGEPAAVASDVYQLGLLLYELLVGRRAQRVTIQSTDELARVVCDLVPPAPSAAAGDAPPETCAARQLTRQGLVRALRGDLDTIVLCAIRKEPERRYATAADLMQDIDRHRQQRPVKARPDRLGYRAERFVRRHRAPVAAAAIFVAGVAIAGPMVARQQLEAARQAARADEVEQVLRMLLLWSGPGPAAPPDGVHGFLDEATRLVRSQFSSQPRSQARLLLTSAEVHVLLGRYDAAVELLEQALAIRQASFGAMSREAAEVLARLGQAHGFAGRYRTAEAPLRHALAIHAGHTESDDGGLGATLELADVLRNRGALDEAEALVRDAVTRVERLRPDTYLHARALRDLGNVLRDRGEQDASLAAYQRALAMFRAVVGEETLDVPVCRAYLARLLIARGQYPEADRLLQDSLAALRRAYRGDHALTAIVLRDIGYLRLAEGRLDEADAALAEALAITEGLLGRDHPLLARVLVHQADLAWHRRRPSEAARLAAATLDQLARAGLTEHPLEVDARHVLALARQDEGRTDDAAAEWRRALQLAERHFAGGDVRIALIRAALRDVR